jgi:peptidoglycan/LPS O-acetylase OafA/YrhL
MQTINERLGIPFRNNNFDLIRIFAALQVLLFHAIDRLGLHSSPWLRPFSFFHGVPIFFVASGFMVSASYERQNGDVRRYFRNRALRIFPGLWVCIAITAAAAAVLGFRPHTAADLIWAPAQMLGLIYTPQFLHSFGTGTYNGALWTIPLELQFYIALPFVYLLMRYLPKRSNQALWAVFGLFVLCSLVLAHIAPTVPTEGQESYVSKLVRYSLLPQFYLFLFGAILQRHRVYALRWVADKGLYWAAGYIVVSYLQPGWPSTLILTMLLLGLTTISLAYTARSLGKRLLNEQDVSYGVYIYHGLIINVLVSLGLVGAWRDVMALVLLTIGIAFLSWRYVERPMLKTKEKVVPAEVELAL